VIVRYSGQAEADIKLNLSSAGFLEGERLHCAFSCDTRGHASPNAVYAVKGGVLSFTAQPYSAYIFSAASSPDLDYSPESQPRVTKTFPVDGAKGLPNNTRVIVQFSEAMNQAEIKNAFSITPAVPGSFVWNGSICAFIPDQALTAGFSYEVRLRKNITSAQGGFSLRKALQFTFTVQ
jgi:hypothetical protein